MNSVNENQELATETNESPRPALVSKEFCIEAIENIRSHRTGWPTPTQVDMIRADIDNLLDLADSLRSQLAESDDNLNSALTEQRQQLGVLHDETLVELKRVRVAAKDEIEHLQSQLANARNQVLSEAIEKVKAIDSLTLDDLECVDPQDVVTALEQLKGNQNEPS